MHYILIKKKDKYIHKHAGQFLKSHKTKKIRLKCDVDQINLIKIKKEYSLG